MEMVEKYDNKRMPLNKIEERYNIIPNEYKQSVHIWIMNKNGEFLIQKRSPNKKSYPNMWSITGGATEIGEITLQTVIRECKEELSIDVNVNNLELIMTLKVRHDFTDIWLLKQDIDIENIVLQKEELTEVKWITVEDLKTMIDKKQLAPNIAFYFEFLEKLWKL